MLSLVRRIWWNYQKKNLEPPFFFQNGRYIAKMSTLSDFNENWYLGVLWCGEHDGNIEKKFRAAIFFFQNGHHIVRCQLSSDFNENLDLGVIWCGEHDGVIKIDLRATIFMSTAIRLMMTYFNALVARWAIQAPGSL